MVSLGLLASEGLRSGFRGFPSGRAGGTAASVQRAARVARGAWIQLGAELLPGAAQRSRYFLQQHRGVQHVADQPLRSQQHPGLCLTFQEKRASCGACPKLRVDVTLLDAGQASRGR